MKHETQIYRGSSSRRGGIGILRLIGLALIVAGLALPFASGAAQQQSEQGVVYVVQITGTIDLGLAPFLQRIIDEAEDDPAARAVLLEIDTPGGRLDAALQMRKTLLGSSVPTIAYVNREAFSAGALIAIAAHEIYFAPGGVMGAATPVDATGESASEKVVSAVRSTFEATAQERGRDPAVAEAMVDPEVVVEGLVERGKLLTLTTEEALAWGYAEGVAPNRSEVLRMAGLDEATVIERSPSLAERVVRWLTEPVIASLLFSIGFLLIIGDLLAGGGGLFAAAGVGMVAVFFWGHFLAGLAGWEGVVLVVLGLALIAAEVFVIPGFGVAGVLGTVSLLAGLFLTVQGREITTGADTRRAITAVGIALAILVAGAILAFLMLPQATRFRTLALETRLSRTEPPDALPEPTRHALPEPQGGGAAGVAGADVSSHAGTPAAANLGVSTTLLGATGVARSDLRPGGIADIEGERVDVVSEGGYILAGTAIVVVRDEGYRRVVRELDGAS